jgi:protocatechuate 3,4-dioxygenase beta subunit
MLLDARSCRPLQNAAVDVWQCDAQGVYSGYTQQSMMAGPGGPMGPRPEIPGPPPPGGMGGPLTMKPSDAQTFLRGIQITDANGAVAFHTVFPGYYMGRTNHIHFRVRIDGHEAGKTYVAGHVSHTGQVFFPEHVVAQLMQQEPYRLHTIHRTTQAEDEVFQGQHGGTSVATVRSEGAGLISELVAVVNPAAMPVPVEPGGPGGPPPSIP